MQHPPTIGMSKVDQRYFTGTRKILFDLFCDFLGLLSLSCSNSVILKTRSLVLPVKLLFNDFQLFFHANANQQTMKHQVCMKFKSWRILLFLLKLVKNRHEKEERTVHNTFCTWHCASVQKQHIHYRYIWNGTPETLLNHHKYENIQWREVFGSYKFRYSRQTSRGNPQGTKPVKQLSSRKPKKLNEERRLQFPVKFILTLKRKKIQDMETGQGKEMPKKINVFK